MQRSLPDGWEARSGQWLSHAAVWFNRRDGYSPEINDWRALDGGYTQGA